MNTLRNLLFYLLTMAALTAHAAEPAQGSIDTETLAEQIQTGDIVFIRIGAEPFKKVAEATHSWTNHVGIVIGRGENGVQIAESTFPFSRITTLDKFAKRSEGRRVAVMRLKTPLSPEQQQNLASAVNKRLGIFYDTGFNLHSSGQFCSRFVHEVLHEAAGIQLGEVENFATLLSRNPGTDLGFWHIWYFGRIPWDRQTVTPASELNSPLLKQVFDGVVRV